MEEIMLSIIILVLLFLRFRDVFKISYYEAKLINCGVDISRVKNMPFYKIWLD